MAFLNTKTTTGRTGWWRPEQNRAAIGDQALLDALNCVTRPLNLIDYNGQLAVATDGNVSFGSHKPSGPDVHPLIGYAPTVHPQNLGDSNFKKNHNLRYAYVVGAMANGITSVEMVVEAGRNGMIGFFGAAGLMPVEIEAAIDSINNRLASQPFGMNLIHSPTDPKLEAATVDLYLKRGINLISASAYLDLTLPLVYYRVNGIRRNHNGEIICPGKVVAKVSRIEVARKFLSPPPQKFLSQLVDKNLISSQQAELAASIPMADDLTAEADSGGHTDNRPALALLPTMLALRDEIMLKHGYQRPVRIGLAGGIATPESTAAAFAMGAAFVLTGSINQACIESGTSDTVRQMLAEAEQADVIMAPSADMFELGVKVQVLKRGTMFAMRAAKLFELYSNYNSYGELPAGQREILQRDYFRCTFQEEWEQTKRFFAQRDPKQIEIAEKNPRHMMALVFRSYLGRSSTWANTGDPSRKIDYQIWCGPSMGAFNQWSKGTFLEKRENRKTVIVAMNLMLGAAVITRVNWLRCQGIALPRQAEKFSPLELSKIQQLLDE